MAAMSAVWAAAALSGLSVQAQDVRGNVDTAQAARQRVYNVPPQALSSALILFGQQSGRQITVDASLVQGLSTQGVQGTMTVEEALQRLLTGTGLTYGSIGGTTISLYRQGTDVAPGVMQIDPVQVQGNAVPPQAMIDNLPPPYAGGQVATGGQLGLLGNRDVMDTPFNQTSYTAKKAQDQQAKTIRDVLVDDPSVRFFVPDGGVGADQAYVRGFNIQNSNTSYGGLFGMLPSVTIMAELAERIELLKGPNVMLNGMPPASSIGGLINIVPKRAPNGDMTQLTVSYASTGQFGGHADVARRFGEEKQFGVRFNGVFKAGQTEVQWNSDQRALGVLSLDFRGEQVRIAADLGYQYQYVGGMIPYLGVADNLPLPWAPNARKNVGQPWNYSTNKDLFGVVRAEIDLAERVTAYAAVGAHDNRVEQLNAGTRVTAMDIYGNASTTPLNFSSYNTYFTVEAGLRGMVDTGPIGHEFALTATTYSQVSGDGAVTIAPVATNIYNPIVVARPNIPTPAANKTSTNMLSSFGLADTLSAAGKRIQLTVGARLQQVGAANFDPTTGVQTSTYDQSAVSPSVALVFKPWENVSVYGNWIQGLQRGTIVDSAFSNAGEVFPPFKSTQYEAGVKVDWGRFTSTVSAFQISQPSLLTNTANNTLFLGGEQRNQGLEFNIFGEPMAGVRLLGGFMLLSPVLTQTEGGLTDGWIAPNTPTFQFNAAGEWDLPFVRGLTLNGRVIYTGSQYIDTEYPRRSLPEWTRVDLGARYTFDNATSPTGKPVALRFVVENLLDANYWAASTGATTMNLGAPRTFRLALTTDF
jgi:iron complex outermembrane receptor protein